MHQSETSSEATYGLRKRIRALGLGWRILAAILVASCLQVVLWPFRQAPLADRSSPLPLWKRSVFLSERNPMLLARPRPTLVALSFYSNRVWALDKMGNIFSSEAQGATWQSHLPRIPEAPVELTTSIGDKDFAEDLARIQFCDDGFGWAEIGGSLRGELVDVLFKTTNGGSEWELSENTMPRDKVDELVKLRASGSKVGSDVATPSVTRSTRQSIGNGTFNSRPAPTLVS